MKAIALSQEHLRLVMGGQDDGSGGGDGVEPPKVQTYLKSKHYESKGSGGGDGVEPPKVNP